MGWPMRQSIGRFDDDPNHIMRARRGTTGRSISFGLPWPGPGPTLLVCLGLVCLVILHDSPTDCASENQDLEEITALRGPAETINSLAFSPDQRTLAVLGLDQSLVLWDVRARRIAARMRPRSYYPYCMAYSGDGQYLVTADADGVVSLRDPKSCEETRALATGHLGVSTLAVAPRGGLMALGHDHGETIGKISLLDLASGREQAEIDAHKGTVICLLFSRDGKLLISAGFDGAVKLWDTASGRLVQTLPGHRGPVAALALADDGKTLASATVAGGEVKLWDTSSALQLRSFTIPDRDVTSLVFCPGGRTLAASYGTISSTVPSSIHLWDVKTGRECGRITGHTNWIECLSLSADGSTLASGGYDSIVQLWKIAEHDEAE